MNEKSLFVVKFTHKMMVLKKSHDSHDDSVRSRNDFFTCKAKDKKKLSRRCHGR